MAEENKPSEETKPAKAKPAEAEAKPAEAEAKKEEKAAPPPKQVGVIMFAKGIRPKGGTCVMTTNNAALVADAKAKGYQVEVHDDCAEIFFVPPAK